MRISPHPKKLKKTHRTSPHRRSLTKVKPHRTVTFKNKQTRNGGHLLKRRFFGAIWLEPLGKTHFFRRAPYGRTACTILNVTICTIVRTHDCGIGSSGD